MGATVACVSCPDGKGDAEGHNEDDTSKFLD